MVEDLTYMRAYVAYENIFREVAYIGVQTCVLPNVNMKYMEYTALLKKYQVDA